MTTTHRAGPLVVFGSTTTVPTPDYNPDIGTSLFWAGDGTLDQRKDAYWCYQPGDLTYQGWLGVTNIMTLNGVPAALGTASIAASQLAVTATPMSLVTANARGITVGASVVKATTGATVSSLLLLDAVTCSFTGSITAGVLYVPTVANGNITVGSVVTGTNLVQQTVIGMAGMLGVTGGGTTGTYLVTPGMATATTQISMTGVAGLNGVPVIPGNPTVTSPIPGSPLAIQGPKIYNPSTMIGRNVTITTSSGDTAVYTVAGFDIYGYAQTEAITGNGATTVSGKKAFKYLQSVTPVGTVGALTTIGTGDVYGFPLASLTFQDVSINFSATVITASTGYLAMDLTNPATTTTGDVRGTYAVQSAADGTKRLTIWQSPPPTNIIDSRGLFGMTPV